MCNRISKYEAVVEDNFISDFGNFISALGHFFLTDSIFNIKFQNRVCKSWKLRYICINWCRGISWWRCTDDHQPHRDSDRIYQWNQLWTSFDACINGITYFVDLKFLHYLKTELLLNQRGMIMSTHLVSIFRLPNGAVITLMRDYMTSISN